MHSRALSAFGNDLWLTSSRHSQYCWFYSHLSTNRQASGFRAWVARIESSCDTVSGGCIGATKLKGNTPGLRSLWAANLWFLGEYCREIHLHTWSSLCPSSSSPEHYWRQHIRPGGSLVWPKAAIATVLRLFSPLLIKWLRGTAVEERTTTSGCPLLCPTSRQL